MRGTEIMVTVEGRSSLCGTEGGRKRSERERGLTRGRCTGDRESFPLRGSSKPACRFYLPRPCYKLQ